MKEKLGITTQGSLYKGKFALGIVLSILSGVLILLAFPPYGVWWLMWVALVPYAFAQHRLLPRKWASLAPALAMLFWLGPYLARLFGPDFGIFLQYMGVWIGILVFFLQKERKFHELTGYKWFIMQGVVNWVGFEMIRTFIPLLATNAFVGYTQATQAWLIQPVSIFSIYGLNLVIMLVNFALAQGVMAWFDRKWQHPDVVPVDERATMRWLGGMGISLAVWIGISLVILNGAPTDAATVRVAALQPNFPQPAFIDEETPPELRFDRFVEQARKAAEQDVQVISTPEMGFDFDPQVENTAELIALAEETGAYLFIAYTATEDEFRNEAVVITPEGEFLEVYGKNHAFGEPPTPSAGVYPVYDIPQGRLATLICHDANYTDVARTLTRNGAQLIAAGFREFGGFGEQLWTNVVFRAVENRVSIVFTGVATSSGVVDPYGRLIALEVDIDGEQVTIIEDVPLGLGNTPLVRLGDWLGWIMLAGYVFFMVFQSMTERRAKREELKSAA
jgi:apolipoprotein N-acyltransferase